MNIGNLVDLREDGDSIDGFVFPLIYKLTKEAVDALVKGHQIPGQAPDYAIVRNGVIVNGGNYIEPRLDTDLSYSLICQKGNQNGLKFCTNTSGRMSKIRSPKNILQISGNTLLTTQGFYDKWKNAMERFNASDRTLDVSSELGLTQETYLDWKEIMDDAQ